jgi:hypothetical protein
MEGKLLVDHLDRQAAKALDAKTNYQPPTDDLDRSKSEEEEKDEAPNVTFTSLFDKIVVHFQTVYEKQSKKTTSSPAKKKKSTRRSSASPKPSNYAAAATTVDVEEDMSAFEPEYSLSTPQRIVWVNPLYASEQSSTKLLSAPDTSSISNPSGNKEEDNPRDDGGDDSSSRHKDDMAVDADVISFKYTQPPQNKSNTETVHSVLARVELYRHHMEPMSDRPGDVPYYVLSADMQQWFFPHHGPALTDILSGQPQTFDNDNNMESTSEKKDSVTGNQNVLSTELVPPSHNQVFIPHTLTMIEISNALFVYIRDRKLVATGDVVHADQKLQDLLGMEQFSFSQLQQLLKSRNLIQEATVAPQPIRVTYILEEESASTLGVTEDKDVSLLQMDVDVTIPSYFPYRARELLRRIKRRELEYTSSRTRARWLLQTNTLTKSDDGRIIRQAIEQAVQQQRLPVSSELVPVYLALAKAAPPQTEARMAGHVDARTAYLWSQLEEQLPSVYRAREAAEACRDASCL